MASEIASHAFDRAQALHEVVLAIQIVVELYMSSSGKHIDDLIFLMDYFAGPLGELSEEVVLHLREVVNAPD
ncbi:hypothetical protein [Streptomyces cyaneofuscatus]|uniref:Uncharacterized protein n=1 Tax=uncultured prokaryote TaxID=198431 RepID=A0A0H5Q4Q3_9ZZZZ|nr:hypothetical protein [uncultured prokaryote]